MCPDKAVQLNRFHDPAGGQIGSTRPSTASPPVGDGTPGPLTVALRDRFWALMDEPSARAQRDRAGRVVGDA